MRQAVLFHEGTRNIMRATITTPKTLTHHRYSCDVLKQEFSNNSLDKSTANAIRDAMAVKDSPVKRFLIYDMRRTCITRWSKKVDPYTETAGRAYRLRNDESVDENPTVFDGGLQAGDILGYRLGRVAGEPRTAARKSQKLGYLVVRPA